MSALRLLGPEFSQSEELWIAELPRERAADVMARLRGLGFGAELAVYVRPRLKRPAIRDGRTREARARRDSTPGFTNRGVRSDEEGRFSLTPEVLALRLGKRAEGHVLDLSCGIGGNAIGFARAGCRVTAVDLDGTRLAMAKHNAKLYGVADRVTFVQADARTVEVDADLAFIDPPWGGDYNKTRTTLEDLPLLADVLDRGRRPLWAKVPPSFDARTVDASAEAWFGEAAGDRHRVKFTLLRF
ncbi:MAG: methyltransferase domain-containing protein [Proteobacteria bacterium]|nr:methyltransferase domain-containing protein [Pseudomonadota bacterium]